MSGSDGLFRPNSPRGCVRAMTSGLRVGSNDLGWPDNMDCLAASVRIFLNFASASAAEVGISVLTTSTSESWVNSGQLAFLKLVKVLRWRKGGSLSEKEMVIGRWSELRATWTLYDTAVAKLADIRES